MKNIILFMGIFLLQHSVHAENDTLILGCRPWDDNLLGLTLKADFIDFNANGKRSEFNNFYHYDFNDNQAMGASKFSAWANDNSEKYQFIVIDWATEQHIRRQDAWQEILSMLKVGGQLVVPISGYNLIDHCYISERKCKERQSTLSGINPAPSSIVSVQFSSKDSEESTWYLLLARPQASEISENGWLLIVTK